ncbi:MAG: M3 family oligoendopeptidase [Patescibacteria group bacterium]
MTGNKTSKIKTDWDFSLLYRNNADSAIERDLQKMEQAHEKFAQKYANKTDYLTDPVKLALALADYEKLSDQAFSKPYAYFAYQHDLDSKNAKVEAKLNLLGQRYTNSGNKITFFGVALTKIKPELQAKFLKHAKLQKYSFLLQCAFREAKHVLSVAEEKIMNLKSLPAHELWVRGNDKIVSKQEILWKNKKLPLAEAMGKIQSLATKERRELHTLVNQKLASVADFAESELNAIVLNKKINDELRGYAQPYSATVLGYQNEEKTVDNLVKTVTKNFHISHRFYKAKAKMLGLKNLTYADRAAPVGQTTQKITFAQAVEIVKKAFGRVNPIYVTAFEEFLANGQIDVFPKVGKTGGAYCSSTEGLPTFVLLNHLSDFKSLMTLAHELGHAMHARLGDAAQPPLYRGHSIATAEVASTLFENFVFDEVFNLLTEKEKIIALHDRINDSVMTIFRQIACFNFELDLHNQIRKQGSLSKEKIAKLLNQHMSAYLGPVFKLTEADGYFFVSWSHLRNFFYVYSYAFGELVSNALYSSYQENNKFEEKIRQFLSAGSSASPEDIFAQVGVDVRNPAFFERGLKEIEAKIAKLEEMI